LALDALAYVGLRSRAPPLGALLLPAPHHHVQLGFVLDQTRCIGCHACTVACKSENDVPLGSFRTWVKYTEEGAFPTVKRSFTVLRCNQCSDAPCVTICPVSALEKRQDGIVDVDPAQCIGCKACMQGCPYDALYINEGTGTAQKCHFCAHRTEQGLAPACAIVCPTEAIIPGDFDDPNSRVSQLKASGTLTARKTEAGTRPNVWYRGASEAGTTPIKTQAAGGYLWSNQAHGEQYAGDVFRAAAEPTLARTVYDVEHAPLWGWRVSAYLLTKSLSAGAAIAGFWVLARGGAAALDVGLLAIVALFWLAVTGALLIWDLKRPERFIKILLRPNWTSWLAKGSVVIGVHGAILAGYSATVFRDAPMDGGLWAALGFVAAVSGAMTAGYTAFLFAQAKGRVLWLERGLFTHLVAQATAAGAAMLLLAPGLFQLTADGVSAAREALTFMLGLHLILTLTSGTRSPEGREEEFHEAHALLTKGPFRRLYVASLLAVVAGIVLAAPFAPPAAVGAGAMFALVGLGLYEHAFVRAGQALRIS